MPLNPFPHTHHLNYTIPHPPHPITHPAAAAAHDKDAAKQASKAGGQLSPQALEEYNTLKAQAGTQSSRLLTDKSAAESALQADRQALSTVEEAVAAIDTRMEALGRVPILYCCTIVMVQYLYWL